MGGTHNVGSFCPVIYVYYVTLRAWWPKVLVHFQTITCSLLYLQTKQNKLRNWSEVKIEAVAKRKLQIISYYNYTQRIDKCKYKITDNKDTLRNNITEYWWKQCIWQQEEMQQKGKFGFIMNNNSIIFGSKREWYQGIFPQCTSGIVHGPCSSL